MNEYDVVCFRDISAYWYLVGKVVNLGVHRQQGISPVKGPDGLAREESRYLGISSASLADILAPA